MAAKRKNNKEKRTFYMRMHKMLAGLVRLVLRVHVKGRENIPKTGGMVVCANHVCLLDPVAIAAVCPRQLSFLAKKELFKIPVLRGIIRAFGAFPLDRRGDVGALRHAITLAAPKAEGSDVGDSMVLIFPQGTRRQKQNPCGTPVKSGAAMVAFNAGVPMLPVCVRMKKMKFCLFRRIDVIIGKPMTAEELGFNEGGSQEFTAATKKVFREVCRLGNFLPEDQTASANEN